MKTARIYVDFNEMISNDEVLLSRHDSTMDSEGKLITLFEGMPIGVYSDDLDEEGKPDKLIADGVAMRNTSGWMEEVRWLLKIDQRGVRHESDEAADANEKAT